MPKINAATFSRAYTEEWHASALNTHDGFPPQWSAPTSWSSYMLEDGGLLYRVMKRLPNTALVYAREPFKVDALYYTGSYPFGKQSSMEVSRLHVLVEHEHGMEISEEMRRLLCLSCPLKVVIFYDYTEKEKQRNPGWSTWANDVLQMAKCMITDANNFFPENGETEYLMLFASRLESKGYVQWSMASCKAANPDSLIDSPNRKILYSGQAPA